MSLCECEARAKALPYNAFMPDWAHHATILSVDLMRIRYARNASPEQVQRTVVLLEVWQPR